MLAPRKKLWSTPSNVLDVVCEWITLKPKDVVCDIGCGDGRVILQLAAHWTAAMNRTRQECSFANDEEPVDKNKTQPCDDTPTTTMVSFIGLDINPERVQEANWALEAAKREGRVHPQLSVTFHCANAMEAMHLYQDATVFFLYLIPRGLKIFKPLLLELLQKRYDENADEKSLTVLTYMSPLPDERFSKKEVCQVEHQPGAAWPVYLYHLSHTKCKE